MGKQPEEYGSEIMLSRELSWLDFNSRVLDEAGSAANPVLERMKFIAIFSGNLDEFFMVRVAGLRQLEQLAPTQRDPAGLTATEQLIAVRKKLEPLLKRQYACWREEIVPELARNGIGLKSPEELPEASQVELQRYFAAEILPILTPLAIDPSHPFPVLTNGAIELAVRLRRPGREEEAYAFVEVPEVLPRFVEALTPGAEPGEKWFVPLEELIDAHLPELFSGCEVLESLPFRITRDMDFTIAEEGVADLLRTIKNTLVKRRSREPIRLELPRGTAGTLRNWLLAQFDLDAQFRYQVPGMLHLKQLFELVGKVRRADLIEPSWVGLPHPELPETEPIFDSICEHGSVLLAVPFQRFDPVVRLIESAAVDPAVLAIKQTLYRVSGDSPVVHALQRAAERGKQVTVIVELKARFDEGNNIVWAQRLEASGAHVVYGISGLKIHAKALLIVRREEGLLRRYVHLATGNYNDKTATMYTDLSLFSCDAVLAGEVSLLFNIMTGYAMPERDWRKLAVAPFDLRRRLLALIDREARFSTPGNPGRITAKMNSLVDPEIIRHLYAAADAGVEIELIVRGICCLKPGVGNDNIRVISIVDRYLEHSRVFRFGNNGQTEYYLSSADWMGRNLDRRIELLFPIEKTAQQRVIDRILELELADDEQARQLKKDGRYTGRRVTRHGGGRSQYATYKFFETLVHDDGADTIFKVFKPEKNRAEVTE